jgi:signal transduction histidine kinase
VDGLEQTLLELRALQRVAATITRSLDLDEVLRTCLDVALEVAHLEIGSIAVYDEAEGRYNQVVHRGAPEGTGSLTFDAQRVESIVGGRSSVAIDLQQYPSNTPLAAAVRRAGLRQTLLVPLRLEGRRIGVLVVASLSAEAFPQSTTLTLEAIAAAEAVAIANARAHRLLAERARLALAVREFSEQGLASATEDELYRRMLDTATKIARSDRGLVAMVVRGKAKVMVATGADTDLVGAERDIEEPPYQAVFADRRPYTVHISDALDRDGPVATMLRRRGTASAVFVPIHYGDQPVGVLFTASGVERRYPEETLTALQILVTMAAELIERARIRAEAKAREEQLVQVIEHLPIVVTVIGTNGEILHNNVAAREFSRQMGRSGKDWRPTLTEWRFFYVDGRPIEREQLPVLRALNGDRPAPMELVIEAGESRHVVMAMAAPIVDEDGVVRKAVAAFQDVSALRELANAKDRFLSVASHELRSPIASLRATASLLELDPTASTDPVRRGALLGRIQHHVERVNRLIEQLLDSARLNSHELPLELVDADLVEICREAIELATQVSTGHQVVLEESGPVLGRWDRSRIEQAATNLINNAIRYSPHGGQITVRVRTSGADVMLEVRDHGIGIPPEQVARLFSPFFRGRHAPALNRGGLGLGLYITREIVRRHGGVLEVESTPGSGSSFRMTLPRAATANPTTVPR